MRIITVINSPAFQEFASENRETVERELGYLSLWGNGSERYERVTLLCGDDGTIQANYRSAMGSLNYRIVGTFSDGRYTNQS